MSGYTKICLYCKQTFTTNRGSQIYCCKAHFNESKKSPPPRSDGTKLSEKNTVLEKLEWLKSNGLEHTQNDVYKWKGLTNYTSIHLRKKRNNLKV
jgi:hypothetical protein